MIGHDFRMAAVGFLLSVVAALAGFGSLVLAVRAALGRHRSASERDWLKFVGDTGDSDPEIRIHEPPEPPLAPPPKYSSARLRESINHPSAN